MDVAVTGSSGLIGTALRPALERAGHRVVRVVRQAAGGDSDTITWDPEAGTIDAAGFEGLGAVVHLAGEGIGDRRWNEAHKARVLDSRVKGTTLLAETLARLNRPPGVLVSGSAIGFYGDRGEQVLTEESPGGQGFLASVCRHWEAATGPAEQAGIRVVHLRTGIVLSREGGALKKMLTPFKAGVGGRMGSGRQWMSWISLDDEIGAIVHLLGDAVSGGPVNATAPHPVTNAEFSAALGRALGRPSIVPVPAPALKVALGAQMAEELLLYSQRVVPTRLLESGYQFQAPELRTALEQALAQTA